MKISTLLKLVIGMCLCVLVGCKSKKKAIASGKLDKRLTTKELVKYHTATSPNFKTLAARVKIDITEGEISKGYTVNLRLEKDKQILLTSTPITLVKAIITPNRVAFYNKLDGTYFDGDFSYLSDLLGTELNYEKVQNLLLGEAIYKLLPEENTIDIHQESYVMSPKEQADLFEVFFLFNPKNFKLNSQQIAQKKESRFLEINYLDYQDVVKQKLPKTTRILAVDNENQMAIDLEYKSVSLNDKLRFPFRIPQGYKKIELK